MAKTERLFNQLCSLPVACMVPTSCRCHALTAAPHPADLNAAASSALLAQMGQASATKVKVCASAASHSRTCAASGQGSVRTGRRIPAQPDCVRDADCKLPPNPNPRRPFPRPEPEVRRGFAGRAKRRPDALRRSHGWSHRTGRAAPEPKTGPASPPKRKRQAERSAPQPSPGLPWPPSGKQLQQTALSAVISTQELRSRNAESVCHYLAVTVAARSSSEHPSLNL